MDDIINYQRKEEEDFYVILGCNENSTEEQINAEYKARVLGCHPDKHPEDAAAHEQFSKLSKAKHVLLDPEKRKDYDKWRNSDISISYDRWKSMKGIKTSMHWGQRKEQPALTNQNQPVTSTPDHNQSPIHRAAGHPHTATSSSAPSSSNGPVVSSTSSMPPMNFVKRERPKVTGWESDTSNPLLKKFRNYEI